MFDWIDNRHTYSCPPTCQLHYTYIVQLCIGRLKAKFPKSQRVRKLEGMFQESEGHLDVAREMYEEFLEEEPLDQVRMCMILALCST